VQKERKANKKKRDKRGGNKLRKKGCPRGSIKRSVQKETEIKKLQ
jgi:hypothetical protein